MCMLVENKPVAGGLDVSGYHLSGLQAYIEGWANRYQNEVQKIDLFKRDRVELWRENDKKLFLGVFYHLRGHFAEFLWHMGSFAPNKKTKQLILGNIEDEFNLNGFSHEELYLRFASSFNIDLTYELIDEKFYRPFAREYIKGQLRWLRMNDWDSRLSAFAAIEFLDNVDYINFKEVAIWMGAEKNALTFFNVHIYADHFESILNSEFILLWKENSDLIKKVFEFVLEYQISMFKKFSNEIFSSIKTME